MRRARLSAAFRGSTPLVALAAILLPVECPAAQESARRLPGAILVQAVDTSINPIPAEIILPAFEVSARVNDDGAVLFVNVPDGLYVLQARHLGHRPEWRFVRVTGDTIRLEIVLTPVDVRGGVARAALPESRLREFLRRTALIPVGTFLTRTEIERRRARNLVALLARLPDIIVDRAAGGPPVVRSERVTGPQCTSGMLVFVDAVLPTGPAIPEGVDARDSPRESRLIRGLRVERRLTGRAVRWDSGLPSLGSRALNAGGDPTAAARRAASIMDRIPITRVAALEVYPTLAGVPPEFRVTGAECGVVLVWTG
jgi:hypothetical protein